MNTTDKKTPDQHAAALVGATFRVTEGCRSLYIAKRNTGVVEAAVWDKEAGCFRVTLNVAGMIRVLYAANSARISGLRVTLNNGNPLRRVALSITRRVVAS